MINEIKNADKKKKRFLSMFTAIFMTFTTLGSSLSVSADPASSIDGIRDVTGDAAMNAELLDVPDAEDKFLGMSGDFTIFVKEKFTIPLESADIEGRVAAGGGIENERGTYDIGSKYTGKGASVITGGGKIEQILEQADKDRRFAVTSDTDVDSNSYQRSIEKGNFFISDDLIDFDAEFSKIYRLSDEIAGYSSTGEVKEQYGSYKLVGTSEDVNVFNISESEWEGLSKASYIQVLVPGSFSDTYVFINVPGKNVEMPHYSLEFVQYETDSDGNPVMDGDQYKVLNHVQVKQDSRKEDGTLEDDMLLCGHILYNANDAESVHYTGAIQGSLLAPDANVSGELGGHVSGSTIAKSAEGFGIQAGSITFNPPKKAITPIPDEPVPASEISVKKTDITGGPEIPGAKLVITAKDTAADLSEVTASSAKNFEADENTVTFTSTDKETVIKGLPDGDYTLTETVSPDGYTLNPQTVSFTVKDGKVDGTVEMTDEPSKLTVSKVDVTNEEELPGAVLTLTLEKSTKTANATLENLINGDIKAANSDKTAVTWTSSDKPVVLEGLPDGEYRLKEVNPPSGYTVTADVKFKITDGAVEKADSSVPAAGDSIVDSKTGTVIMKDEISKIFLSKQSFTDKAELEGAEIKLTYNGEGSFENVKQASESGAELTIDKATDTVTWTSGKTPAAIEGLPDGEYSFTETRAPEGYEIAETVKFVIKDGKTSSDTVIMYDEETPELSKVVISKQSAAGSEEVPGAHLTLTADDSSADLSAVTSENEGVKAEKNKITWVSGEKAVVLEGLPDGDYTLEESVAPDGYTVTGAVSFTVENGEVTTSSGNTVVMTDELSEITVSKREIGGTDELDGAELKITLKEAAKSEDVSLKDFGVKVSGGAKDTVIGRDEITFITDAGKPTVITMLPDGKYELTEITSPDGYTVNEETVSFEISDGKLVSGTEVVMEDKPSEISVSKMAVNGTSEIPGAVLTLTLDKSETQAATLKNQISDTVKAANEEVTAVTWTSGKSPVVLTGLPDGEYTLEESVAPDGYTVTDSIKFTIENGSLKSDDEDVDSDKGTVVMRDELSEITISKKDIDGTEELPGATLKITLVEGDTDLLGVTVESEGNPVITKDSIEFVSGSVPAAVKGLPDGKYNLTEITSPDGYTLNEETVKFEIVNGNTVAGNNHVQMLDKPSSVTVSKADVTGAEIPGAVLKLELVKPAKNEKATLEGQVNDTVKAANEEVTAITWTSGKTPVILRELPDGDYVLSETVAPDRYTVTDSIEFTVENGKVKGAEKDKVQMIDELSSVTVSKREITGGPEIPGAKLTVTPVEIAEDATLSDVKVSGGAVNATSVKDRIVFTSGETPAVLEGLPDGKYALTETTSPDGYTVSDETVEFVIEDGVAVNGPVEMLDKPSEVSLSKKAAGGSDEVPGAVLTLTLTKASKNAEATLADAVKKTADSSLKLSEKSDRTVTWTSGAKPVVIKGLPDGEYTLEESVAPDGYTVTDSVTFTVKNGEVAGSENNLVEMFDELSKVTVSKQTVAGSELPGAELTLTNNDKKSLENVSTSSDNKITAKDNTVTWTSGETPVVLEGIPDGTYTLTENQAPLGYDIAESITFTVKNGEVTEFPKGKIVMTDYEAAKPSEVVISKTDLSGVTEIPGAHLKITASDKNADLSKVEASTVNAESEKNSVSWVSGKYPVKLTGLPDGTYTLEESIAPDGYTVTDSITFTLADGTVKGSTNNRVVMKDAPSEVKISKRDANGTEELPGARLTVKPVSETADLSDVKVSGGAKNVSVSSGSVSFTSGTESAVLTQLPDGKYTLTEVHSPDGYEVSEETVSFEVKNGVPVSDSSDKTVVMKNELSKVSVSKTNIAMSEEVPGASLTLTLKQSYKDTAADLKSVAERNDKVSVVKDSDDRKITWISGSEPVVLEGLPDGDYVLEEMAAPDRYTKITGSIAFTVSEGKVESDVSAAPLPNEGRIDSEQNRVIMIDELSVMSVSKTDVTGKEIPGAVLTLTNAEKKDLSSVTSETKLTVNENSVSWVSEETATVLRGLPDGNYTIEETQAPDGYVLTEKSEFTIKNGIPSEAKVVMTDEYSKAVIRKTDVAGSEVPGAKLTLTVSDNKTPLSGVTVSGGASDVVKTDDSISFVSGTRSTSLTGIPDGKYVLTETQAPEGYEIAESVEFTVEGGKVKGSADDTVIMVDERTPVVTTVTTVTTTEAVTTTTEATTTEATTVTTTEATTVTTTEATTVTTTEVTTTVTTPEETLPEFSFPDQNPLTGIPETDILVTEVTTEATTTEVTTVTTTEATTVTTTEATTTEATTTTEETTAATTTEATTTEATTTEETTAATTADAVSIQMTTSETTAVTTTEAPKLTAKSISSTPKTGDTRSTAAIMLFMAGSAAAMVYVTRKKKD